MYPLKFENNLKEKVWGGYSFSRFKENINENIKYGESWELSCHKNGLSIISNGKEKGKTLKELIERYREKILGENIYIEYKTLPILVKFLDICDRLSVQVHPNNEYANKNENERGKAECWYITDASGDARIVLGLKEDISKLEFEKRVKRKDFTGIFNIVEVKKGDFIYIKPGLVHASIQGSISICEVQQSSDTTYRIYDFDRKFNGKKRDLHLKKATEVIAFDYRAKVKDEFKVKKNNGSFVMELLREEYFNVDKIESIINYKDKIVDRFRVYSVLEGKGKIRYNSEYMDIKKYETVFVPANLEVELIGEFTALKTWV